MGKSHLAQALGHRACRGGHSVLLTSADDLFLQQRAARGDGSWERRLLRFTAPDLLILDDLGLKPLENDEPADLYEVIPARCERGAAIVTSDRAVGELLPLWSDVLLGTSICSCQPSPNPPADCARATAAAPHGGLHPPQLRSLCPILAEIPLGHP